MANTNIQKQFNEKMNEIYNEYKHTDQFMLLLTTWINHNEDVLYAQYGV
jgi:DNA gyrase/topoisomerase IV subunit A